MSEYNHIKIRYYIDDRDVYSPIPNRTTPYDSAALVNHGWYFSGKNDLKIESIANKVSTVLDCDIIKIDFLSAYYDYASFKYIYESNMTVNDSQLKKLIDLKLLHNGLLDLDALDTIALDVMKTDSTKKSSMDYTVLENAHIAYKAEPIVQSVQSEKEETKLIDKKFNFLEI